MIASLLLALACSSTGRVDVHEPTLFPVEFGRIRSSLWVENWYGYTSEDSGTALLFLSDEEADCDDALSWGPYYAYAGDDLLTDKGHGVLVLYMWGAWYGDDGGGEGGFEGTYASVPGYVLDEEGTVMRRAYVLAWSEGVLYYTSGYGGGGGYATVSDYGSGEVSGRVDVTALDVGYVANNCGELPSYYDTYDYTYDGWTSP
ncbi:MAG: hypothetical protein ACOZNI_10085 [Myxococcota bacterium]